MTCRIDSKVPLPSFSERDAPFVRPIGVPAEHQEPQRLSKQRIPAKERHAGGAIGKHLIDCVLAKRQVASVQ
jgi:hypothetical protein